MNELNKAEILEKQLSAQEKMAALGALSAGIVHEIQNPLNFVINFGKLSLKLLADLEEVLAQAQLTGEAADDANEILSDLKSNIAKIEENGNRASRIVRSILIYSRVKDEYAAVNLPELVHEYAWLSYQAARTGNKSFNVSITEKYDENLPPVNIIPQEISRVVLNIVNNACYAVFAKAKTALSKPYSPAIIIEAYKDGDNAKLIIEDNGTGISDEAKAMLFTPFFTTKPIGEGTGIGLSISKSIIEGKHRGQLAVESRLNEFTRFIITLPLS
jgi:signal transduction histidine kinase